HRACHPTSRSGHHAWTISSSRPARHHPPAAGAAHTWCSVGRTSASVWLGPATARSPKSAAAEAGTASETAAHQVAIGHADELASLRFDAANVAAVFVPNDNGEAATALTALVRFLDAALDRSQALAGTFQFLPGLLQLGSRPFVLAAAANFLRLNSWV